jgi:tetratricopeptide (TPR) repeat protein
MTRRSVIAAAGCGAVGCGTAAWLLLGPLWAVGGAVLGPAAGVAAYGTMLAFLTPDAAVLVADGRPEAALRELRAALPSLRRLARIWPGEFRGVLGDRLLLQSDALHALHQDERALGCASEAVGIFQSLAAGKPGRHGPDLADALDRQSRLLAARGYRAEAIAAAATAAGMLRRLAAADQGRYLPALAETLTAAAGWLAEAGRDGEALGAADEATGIYWQRLPQAELPPDAARAALLAGRLLGEQGRRPEAARMLARGWDLAARQDHHAELRAAAPALRSAYDADPDGLAAAWRAETGAEPPGWPGRPAA